MTEFCEVCNKKLGKRQKRFCCYQCYWEYKKTHHESKNIKYSFLSSPTRKNKLYQVWCGILRRCNNKSQRSYKDYGGRGITVCDEWKNNFKIFYDWAMQNGYSDNLTIDRIDVNGNYEPNNCRFITNKQQSRNRRNNKIYTLNNQTHCLSEWAEIYNIDYKLVWGRINSGWDIKKALKTPTRK